MDDRRFDALARALGGASTRRSALGALAGVGLAAGGAAREAEAKKKRKRCQPECAAGQTCRQGTCACDNGGSICGATCCRTGQGCEGGACIDPAPACIPAGEACKGAGRACCDGRTCASGQGGKSDIACYIPAGGACGTTAECVFDSTCTEGVCVANPHPAPAPACTVCASGCPYSTIDAAIAAAAPGAEITVAAGTYVPAYVDGGIGGVAYRDYLTIRRPVTLRACTAGARVVVSCPEIPTYVPSITTCISVVDTYGVVLDGLTVQGPGGTQNGMAGVSVSGSGGQAGAEIRNCAITGAGFGVYSAATVSIAGTLSVADGDIGLSNENIAGASITCAAGSSVSFSSVIDRCDTQYGTITGCPCSSGG